ncbi:MAG: DUF4147 domain-containing protein [Deltaproteobacteria bacterium]|nr:DUF4147 domain-containing protein [Deltaproteobacteria bacterium]MBW2359888.1 DUF4147 domain-containing protein [Deltaproteobacteria bacterium]
MSAPDEPARAQLLAIFREALAAVDGAGAVRGALRREAGRLFLAGEVLPTDGRLRLLALGKAAGPMAAAFEAIAGEALVDGLAVTKHGHGVALSRVRLIEAAHPVPDASCVAAAAQVLRMLEAALPDDVVCVLLSGGTSSLLASPLPGVTTEELARTTQLLLEAGADIAQTNAVRRRLTVASGGRLARHCAARRIEVLVLSDVPGDTLEVIGSGPFTAAPTDTGDARAALCELGLLDAVPASVRARCDASQAGAVGVPVGDPALRGVRHRIVGSNRVALEAARGAAVRMGLDVRLLSPPLAGEARDAGALLARLALRARPPRPLLLLAGGETHVSVRGSGRGGRNQELALAAALALEGRGHVTLLAAGTDGSDGPTQAAGAFADGASVARGAAAGVDARAALADNDSHAFFAAEGGLLRTGPTGTNVMDLALVHVRSSSDRS